MSGGGVEKLERVCWRLREAFPGQARITNKNLRLAIDKECGIYDSTYYANKKALIRLGFIVTAGRHHIRLTGKEIIGECLPIAELERNKSRIVKEQNCSDDEKISDTFECDNDDSSKIAKGRVWIE